MRGVILIGGIHGVGKSTAVKKLTEKFSIPNYTASKIIKDMKNITSEDSTKLTSDIENNQKLLINGIQRILNDHDTFLLDGHFTLLNADSKIERIDIEVFKQLSIKGILLLQETAKIIHNRLLSRDGKSISLELISNYQIAEENHAENIAGYLDIPIKKICNYNDNDLFIAFESLQSSVR